MSTGDAYKWDMNNRNFEVTKKRREISIGNRMNARVVNYGFTLRVIFENFLTIARTPKRVQHRHAITPHLLYGGLEKITNVNARAIIFTSCKLKSMINIPAFNQSQ